MTITITGETKMTHATDTDMFDPAFAAKVAAYVAADDAAFAAWLDGDDFDTLIGGTVAAGKAAYTAALSGPELAKPVDTFAMIALDGRRSRHLVQALADRGIGRVDLSSYTYDITIMDIVKKKRTTHYAAYSAGVEAFALALSVPGFELQILRQ